MKTKKYFDIFLIKWLTLEYIVVFALHLDMKMRMVQSDVDAFI